MKRWLIENKELLDKLSEKYNKIDVFYLFDGKKVYCYSDDEEIRPAQEDIEFIPDQPFEQKRAHPNTLLLEARRFIIDRDFFVERYFFGDEQIAIAYMRDKSSLQEQMLLKEHLGNVEAIDVTKSVRYDILTLIRCGKPLEYEITEYFEKIDRFEAGNLFFWQVPGGLYFADAIALLFYRYIRLLRYYQEGFLRYKNSAQLHRLRVIMRRMVLSLELFSDLFEEPKREWFVRYLNKLYYESKELRYLYFIDELQVAQKSATLSFSGTLSSELREQRQKLIDLLSSDAHEAFLQQFAKSVKQPKKACEPFEGKIRVLLKKRFSELEHLLSQSRSDQSEIIFHRFFESLERAQMLIEDFYRLIGQKRAGELAEEIDLLLKPLRAYRNCKVRNEIIERLIKLSGSAVEPNSLSIYCKERTAIEKRVLEAFRVLRSSSFAF